MERAMGEDYKEAAKFTKEAAFDASSQANQVAMAATKACVFMKNT